MLSRGWLTLALLAFPALAAAQTVKEADLVGGWRMEIEPGQKGENRAWLVLWPDGLWWFAGPLNRTGHGTARWRLVGDTLWLANDHEPYMMSMADPRLQVVRARGHRDFAIMDMAVIKQRKPYPVADSVYWSPAFRDTVSTCAEHRPCDTWVYKVSKKDQQLHLVFLEGVSRGSNRFAAKAVMTRDSVVNCGIHGGCKK